MLIAVCVRQGPHLDPDTGEYNACGQGKRETARLTAAQVGAVMVTELAHTTFNVGSVYIPLVAGFGT